MRVVLEKAIVCVRQKHLLVEVMVVEEDMQVLVIVLQGFDKCIRGLRIGSSETGGGQRRAARSGRGHREDGFQLFLSRVHDDGGRGETSGAC